MGAKTILFAITAITALGWIGWRLTLPPSRNFGAIDAIVPAYNEELCIVQTVTSLLRNPYVFNVIVVNDGSSDRTAQLIDLMAAQNARVIAVHQPNSGKGGALMNGIRHSRADYVFLSDADTIVPPRGDGLGYLLAELERGADAAGGIPASQLDGAAMLPHIRATLKLPMIALRRTFQQLVGGAPFIISGACGLFRRHVLLDVPFSDRTKVEDLDLSWSLVAAGYRIRQCNRCIVYSQECNSAVPEWKRWRRWVIGYAVCMRLHARLLLTRFGLFTIIPMFAMVPVGITTYLVTATRLLVNGQPWGIPMMVMPLIWVVCAMGIASVSAWHYRKPVLVLLAPLAVFYTLLSYSLWVRFGPAALLTGRELERDKPERYAHVVA